MYILYSKIFSVKYSVGEEDFCEIAGPIDLKIANDFLRMKIIIRIRFLIIISIF